MTKKFTAFFVLALAFVLLTVTGQLFGQSLTQPSPNLPPPPGTYISPQLYHQLYAAGIVIKDVSHSKFTQSQPPPPPGGTQIHAFNSQVNMQVSLDGGNTYNPMMAPASVVVQVSSNPAQDIGNTRAFDTEMLQLNISGGSLPPGVMVRESPTLQSLGKTHVTFEDATHYKIDSFFDIFTELSVDGGATWMPATNGSAHMALQGDPKPPIVTTSPDLPAIPSHYVSPADYHTAFANGIVIKDVSHEGFLHNDPPPDTGAGGSTHSFGSMVSMQVSMDGGQTFQGMSAPANVAVHLHKMSGPGGSPTGTFDTEMLQLDISGGSLPPGVMIRESPTLQSTGKTQIDADMGGRYKINSFFDIFPEVSLDGGNTWSPSTSGPTHMEIEPDPPPITTSDPNLPPIPSHYVSPAEWHQSYANGIVIKDVSHERFTHNDPPPPPDSSHNHSFGSTVMMQVSTDGGNTFQPANGSADVTVMVKHKSDNGGTQYFETEMLQLDLTGPGFMVRESPTKQSLGKTSVRDIGGGQFKVNSFFDVFTEVSLDGGASWTPADGPVQMELQAATGSICGMKYNDLNGNGVKDPGEPGLAGWKIKATDAAGVVYSAVTDAAGNYCFPALPPGTYRVEEVLQAGWMQTGGLPFYTLNVAPNQAINGIDFGNFRNGSIYGKKFNDLNGNGVNDKPGEPGLPGWTICATRPSDRPDPSVFPTTGGIDFLGYTTAQITISPYGVPQQDIPLCASGPTTIRRANPSGGTAADSMQTEITLLELKGTLPEPYFPNNDTFIIRHKTDRRSYGAIQGNSFPAYSFFDVFFEIEVPSMGLKMVNKDPTRMSTTINTIPPGAANYFGFNTYLVREDPPYDTLYVVKRVLHCVGNSPGANCDFSCPKPPPPPPPTGPAGTSTTCVVTDASGNYCFMDLPPGSYTLTEVPQAGWTQTTPDPPKIVIESGTNSTTGNDFGNQSCTGRLCIFKYYDANHNNQLDPGEGGVPVSVCFNVTDAANHTIRNCTDASSTVCIALPIGTYTVTEEVPAGYTTSDPKGGIMTVDITECRDYNVNWGNAAGLTDSTFRTATYADWARALSQNTQNKLKAIKCKPDKVEFKLNLKQPQPIFTKLRVVFNMTTRILNVWGDEKNKQLSYTCALVGPADPPKNKVWDFDFNNCPPLPSPAIIQIDGIGLKGALLKVAYIWSTKGGTTVVVKKGVLPGPPEKRVDPTDTLKQILRLPMPNLVDVGQELQQQIVTTSHPFLFTTGAPAGGHSVIYVKYGDVQKSLIKVTRAGDLVHTSKPRWLDFFDKNGQPNTAAPILRQQKGLPPDKHNNQTYANALALQLNILASQYVKFPPGFGGLVYDDHKNPQCNTAAFNGLTVDSIMSLLNQYLATGVPPISGTSASDYDCISKLLNASFAGCPIDTQSWSCVKVKLTGCRTLKEVPYLRTAGPGSVPEYIEPVGPAVQYTPPAAYELHQNYPNPFNPTTTISFDLPEASIVTLEVYNTLGQKVVTLLNQEEMEDGVQEVEFDASSLSSGIYFYRLTATSLTEQEDGTMVNGQTHVIMKKMMLVK
ncbi:MAG: T9SS type A sorting domain-containing protein [Ignavibacteriae bacterium]|nr:T9SS type A sorting domain-containing protein [Ignavibacteria bacterium]MBI3364922.1 T9SS type A sorting domain-containing protein [Ignavibacteriota bacterium]